MVDPFESSTFSLVLAWATGLLVFAWVTFIAITAVADFVTKREMESPRGLPWFGLYYLSCVIVISPVRYMMLQLLLIDTYFVQSFDAILHSLIAGIYVATVWGVLFAASIALPNALIFKLLETQRKASIVMAAILTPCTFALGYAVFFLLLPYAAWTIHWLPARDVIRSANGPASVFYKLVVEPDIPRIGPRLRIPDGDTAKDPLRSHIRETYVSNFKNTKLHFIDSLRYQRLATETLDKFQGFFVTIADSDVKTILTAYKAALREARQVDIALLNESFADLGTMYQKRFIPGLEAAIQGWEESNKLALAGLRGQLLLIQWGEWYNEHIDAIWDAL
jgi:hypothetical protein